MASNQEEAIKRALAAGDTSGARRAYGEYEASMLRSGQTPQSQSSFGIPSY